MGLPEAEGSKAVAAGTIKSISVPAPTALLTLSLASILFERSRIPDSPQ
jgi:hypothetical protein